MERFGKITSWVAQVNNGATGLPRELCQWENATGKKAEGQLVRAFKY